MANPKKSKVVGKRPYAKKSTFWADKKANFNSYADQVASPVVAPIDADNEINELKAACKIIDGWNDQQKARNLRFIFSKYEDYIN